jgi:hypothetical protein
MRHFLPAAAISVLPLGVRVASVTGALVANPGRAH